MANHKSSEKRIRGSAAKQERNKYHAKTARNAIKELRMTKSKVEASKLYPSVASMLDKLAKKNVIHKSKASNLKSSLAKHISGLQ
jgi:small subunit ribosomal protein S20